MLHGSSPAARRLSGGGDVNVVTGQLLREEELSCFPRAAERQTSPSGDIRWRNVPCPTMPTDSGYFVHFSDSFALVNDAMVCLTAARGSSTNVNAVAITIQNKEVKDLMWAAEGERVLTDKARGNDLTQMMWTSDGNDVRVRSFLADRLLVHALVTPNDPGLKPKSKWPELWPTSQPERLCHEALVSNQDLDATCPMVAASTCDARVLDLGENQAGVGGTGHGYDRGQGGGGPRYKGGGKDTDTPPTLVSGVQSG